MGHDVETLKRLLLNDDDVRSAIINGLTSGGRDARVKSRVARVQVLSHLSVIFDRTLSCFLRYASLDVVGTTFISCDM
jgi:hypothetical protein